MPSAFACAAPGCGNPILRRRYLIHGQRFCCAACRNRSWRDDYDYRRRWTRRCAHCGLLTGPDLDGRRSDVKYCSAACRQAAYRTRSKAAGQ
jgi:hypothetical protein